MKYFGLACAALVLTVSAQASQFLQICTNGSVSGGFPGTTTISCPTFNTALLPGGSTFSNEQLIIQTDFSGAPPNTFVDVQASYTSGVTNFISNTEEASGVGGSSTYSTTLTLTAFGGSGAPYWYQLSTASSSVITAFTVSATDSVLGDSAGNPGSITNNAYEVITYTSSTPEPGSMMLLGSGLLAAGLIGRKKLAGRK